MKIFYVGIQRCGTKSFGEFFQKNGFKVWSNSETMESGLWKDIFDCKFNEFLQGPALEKFEVFEDWPFFDPKFARFLANYVPDSRFVYFFRPPEDWYSSMVTLDQGLSPGWVDGHCYHYDRLADLQYLRNQGLGGVVRVPLIGMRDHYVRQYELHRLRIEKLFEKFGGDRFFSASLYDKDKYERMAKAFGMNLANLSDSHAHRSVVSFKQVVESHSYLFRR